VIDETFLAQHRATLVRDQDGWLLRYPLECRSLCDERLKLPIETAVVLAGDTREESLQIAELLLRDHKPPNISAEPTGVQQTPPAKFAMRRDIEIPRGWGRNLLAN
jgi:hypothetical protein